MLTAFRCALLATIFSLPLAASAAEVTVTSGSDSYVSHGLVGFGRIPANQKDQFGETFGSGSALTIDQTSWKLNTDGTYTGTAYMLPDRGYNVEGTTDYKPRLNAIALTIKPVAAGGSDPQQASISASLASSLLLTDETGKEMSGLDPLSGIRPAAGGLPELPLAATGKVSLDPEGLVRLDDGSFFISDEYAPSIYRFGADGKLLGVTLPPAALLPMRGGKLNFASNNPAVGAVTPEPKDPDTGRQNNQGLEGLSMTPDGKFLVAALQSATRQDGGDSGATRDKTRVFVYDLADPNALKLVAEYMVPLPTFKNAAGKTVVAAQSEIVALSDKTILMLARDSGNGYGLEADTSLLRNIELVDLSKATNIAGSDFDAGKAVAPKGVLDPSVTAAVVTPFIDLNAADELGRFGMHNGAPNDRTNLSEKWEGMALASALDPNAPDDYLLFIVNDNDFITQDGFQVGAPYMDAGGADVDTLIQAYRVTIPGLADM